MSNEQIESWAAAIAAHNHGQTGAWTARFEIDGVTLVERAVKGLDALGATMTPNGGPLEYFTRFPSASTREVVTLLVAEGARLCSDQTLAPVP